jgi:mRNA interferase MazF
VPEPVRGEVWLTDLGFAARVRPCLVLSVSPTSTERSLAPLVPHTTSTRTSRFEVKVVAPFLREGAFDSQSLVTVPMPRLIRRFGALSPPQLRQVEASVMQWLGIQR